MTEQAIVIDLTHEPLAIYQSFEHGQALRKQYKLDESDATRTPIVVKFADSTRTVAPRFALGLIGLSVVRSGDESAFAQRMTIQAIRDTIHSDFRRYYSYALMLPLSAQASSPPEPDTAKKHWLVRAAEWLTNDNKRQRVRHASH